MISGVVFITAGEPYTRDACAAARSVRDSNPALQIDLFCDAAAAVPDGIFDRIHVIDTPHRRSKVDCLPLSRFDRTLYLDSDIRVVADLSSMFALLERFDFAAAHAHARNRSQTNARWRHDIPDAFPQLNGGVLLYRKCDKVQELLRDWAQSFSDAGFAKDQVTLRELVWLSDVRLFVLPPEYNVRYPKYLKVWDEDEAKAKILHFKTFNSAEDTNRRKRPLKSLFGLFKG
ncbi:hypothetical protein [Citreimonas salinaria]|uniref:Nucleotide-diphospho-sugar transferase n=1 Tax=Citreimonas salinaria TaxID=321339 RepID=A0A1H3KWC6_9RHOB|nr:hypothetical protein [Citreimonas salinaria]SDY56380.1 hypothetical protein SAMN05444340_110147 [Citreimonas salinaria]